MSEPADLDAVQGYAMEYGRLRPAQIWDLIARVRELEAEVSRLRDLAAGLLEESVRSDADCDAWEAEAERLLDEMGGVSSPPNQP